MAVNPYVNKVVYNNSTLIDLTEDTITPESLLSGYTAHDRSGSPINGAAVIPTKVSDLENDVDYLVETDIVNNLTRGSANPVSSGGVYDALVAKTEWKTFMTATNVSVGNTYAPTGKSFTLTKPAIVRIDMAYGSGRPLAIGMKVSESTSSGSIALTSVVASDISDTSGLSVTALLAAGTYYIWARTASASGSTSFCVYGMELGA